MKIISWNVNGIRACWKKSFPEFLKEHEPDIVCIQETKANEEDLAEEVRQPSGYYSIFHSAEKKGYSGTAIMTKHKPSYSQLGFGNEKYDREGRVCMVEINDIMIFSVYFPNGQMNDDRLNYKLEFYNDFFNYLNDLKQSGKKLIVCGDYNTAHTAIDLARPKENQTVSGFLPIEREWMDKIVRDGYIDTFRLFNSDPEHYTWWSYRTRARERNVGWRIDYCFVTENLSQDIKNAFILNQVIGSDHCPVGIELN